MIQQEKVCTEQYYRIFYSTVQQRYILSCMMTGVAWYQMFFGISEEEYQLYETDRAYLDRIAHACFVMNRTSPRFLCSQKLIHNHTDEQKKMSAELTAEMLTSKKEQHEVKL